MYYTKRGLQAVCIWVLCDAAVRRKKNPSVILPSWNYFFFQKALKKNTNQRATRETLVCDVMIALARSPLT